MDGWLELLGALAGIAAVAALGSWFASGGANALASLVTPWREPGWPRGVQEDDDVRWDWRQRTPDGADTGRGQSAAVLDVPLQRAAARIQARRRGSGRVSTARLRR